MKETWVRPLVWEDPTSHGAIPSPATEPVLGPGSHSHGARVPTGLCSTAVRRSEKPKHRGRSASAAHHNYRKSEGSAQPKINQPISKSTTTKQKERPKAKLYRNVKPATKTQGAFSERKFLWKLDERYTQNAISMAMLPECSKMGEIFFFFCCTDQLTGILVPWPGIEPRPFAVKAWSPNDHWTAREFWQRSVYL